MSKLTCRTWERQIPSPQGPVALVQKVGEQELAIAIFLVDPGEHSPSDLRDKLEPLPGLLIIGQSGDASQAVAASTVLRPQLMIVSSEQQSNAGIEATREIKSELPDLPVLVVSSSTNSDHARAHFIAGASGYCLKNASPERVVLAIRSVSEGAGWIDPELSATVLRPGAARLIPFALAGTAAPQRRLPLSERELEVLRLIAEGMSNQEIASALVLSPETVKTHVKHIMEKLAASDRTQAVVFALRGGLFS